jgi:hypothetical protein
MGSEKTESEWMAVNAPGEDVGFGRKFETMVFLAGKPCDDPKCGCGMPKPDDWENKDFAGYMTAGEAQAGHLAMCKKWSKERSVHAKPTD